MIDGTRFYDQDGNPISIERWGELYADRSNRFIAEDFWTAADGVPIIVRTLWHGTHDYFHNEKEVCTTTVWIGTGVPDDIRRYDTKAEALEGHAQVVADAKVKHGAAT